jgi:hypothetical protein
MSKTNRNLLMVVAVLFALSALTYWQTQGRADRFQRGQLFLSNLNPDEIATIELSKGEETVTLRRQGDQFTVVEKRGYPAGNASVNRLLRDLLEIGLEREVGSGAGLAEELGLEPPGPETVEVALIDSASQEMVRLRVGDSSEGGAGSYVQRLDEKESPIFLTSRGVRLDTDAGSYLDKAIVDHPASEVTRLSGPDFVLAKPAEGGELTLTDLPANRQLKASEASRLSSILSGLRFDEVFVADDNQVAGLRFEPALTIDLSDGSGYELLHATEGERHFLKIRGTNQVQQVAITVDESDEELKEKAEMLSRADEIDAFNSFHGSWVYEISDFTAEKLQLKRSDLMEPKDS